jgi:hypothetical protein
LFDTVDGFWLSVSRAPFTSPPIEKISFLVYALFAARREQHDGALDGCRLLMTPWKDRDFPSLSFAFLREGFFLSIGL